jgi:hypothetical protein
LLHIACCTLCDPLQAPVAAVAALALVVKGARMGAPSKVTERSSQWDGAEAAGLVELTVGEYQKQGMVDLGAGDEDS